MKKIPTERLHALRAAVLDLMSRSDGVERRRLQRHAEDLRRCLLVS